MKAVVCTDFGRAEVREVPTPSPGPEEVLIAVDRVQLSVTECLLYRGERVAHYESVATRLAEGDARLFGHEFCGRIVEAGEAVDGFDVGDRVYAPEKIRCGSCPYCRSGRSGLCPETTSVGYDRPGALAEYVRLPTGPLRRLPEGVSDAEGAALQPMASATLCAVDAEVGPGDTVAVLGTGVMGFQCGALASSFGAEEVYAVDVRDRPLGIAADCGLTPVDARAVDPVETIREATDGVGPDVVFEAVGGDQDHASEGEDPIAWAFDLVRRGGTVVQVGHISGELSVTPRVARSKAIRWLNPRKGVVPLSPRTDTSELAARRVASGAVPIGEYVTHELPGLESFEEAVEITVEKGRHDALGPAQLVVGDG